MPYEFISFNSEVIKSLKVTAEDIDKVCAEHNGLGLRKRYEAAVRAVVELETPGRELLLPVRKLLSRPLYENLEKLIKRIRLGIKNTRDDLLRRLKKTLRQTLLFDLISSIVDVPVKSHDYII